jgi:hypothetical protein
MRTLALALSATALALTARGAPAPLPSADPLRGDLKRLSGEWELEGNPAMRLVVAGDRWTFRSGGRVVSE